MKRIYFLRSASGEGPIKIGCSVYPEARCNQINIDTRGDYVVIADAPGGHQTERNIHLKFDHIRTEPAFVQNRPYIVGAPKEWFEATPELLEFVAAVRDTGAIPLAGHECRQKVIAERYLSGDTLQAIGDDLGLTRERVRQILDLQGIPRRPCGFQYKRAAA